METTRVASSMFVLTIAWTPQAASSRVSPSGRASVSAIARAAAAAWSLIDPPAK